ncbi:MAG: sarcosine oxidase subunit gamma family protein, partial [Pseudomonadota bacterium]
PVLPSPARATRGGEAVAVDVAPGRALIVSERPDLAATLEAALPSDIATTVDLGHARVRLRLSGDRAAWVLSKGVAIDLHADAFPVDAAAATQFDHIGVILHRSGEDVFDLYVYRGFAEALWHELGEAARADGVLAPAAMGG